MNKNSTSVKVASNTIYQIIGKGISMSITMLAVIIITRVYGREGYGAFSLMQSWPALFFIIVDFGVNAIAARELSKDFSKAEKYIGNILLMRIIFSSLVILLLNIVLFFFPYSSELRVGIRLGLFLLLTQALFSTSNIIFQVKLKYDSSVISRLLGYIAILGLILILSYLRVDVMWVNFGYVIGGVITFFMTLKFLKKMGISPKLSFDRDLWKYLLGGALPLGIMFIFSQISFKEDAIMISALRLPESYGLNNTESVAVYALPYKAFEVFLVLPTFFMNSVYPVLVRHMEESKEKLKRTFLNSTRFLVGSGLLVGIIGAILAPFIINILGGLEFSQSILVMRILVLPIVLFYLTSPIAWLIVTLGYQKFLPWVYFVGAAFNMIANFIFIPQYSFYAASIITVLSELIILVLLIFTARKSWKLKYV
jgi:O-antigen/teichoic acid export membrane protein